MPNNLEFMKTPRPIRHIGWREGFSYGRIPSFAHAPMNKYLTDRERRLFVYYIGQADGFAPSARLIKANTHIDEGKIYSIRKQLVEKHFISMAFDRDSKAPDIYILWDSIVRMSQDMIAAERRKRLAGIDAPKSEAILSGLTECTERGLTIGQLNRLAMKGTKSFSSKP